MAVSSRSIPASYAEQLCIFQHSLNNILYFLPYSNISNLVYQQAGRMAPRGSRELCLLLHPTEKKPDVLHPVAAGTVARLATLKHSHQSAGQLKCLTRNRALSIMLADASGPMKPQRPQAYLRKVNRNHWTLRYMLGEISIWKYSKGH